MSEYKREDWEHAKARIIEGTTHTPTDRELENIHIQGRVLALSRRMAAEEFVLALKGRIFV